MQQTAWMLFQFGVSIAAGCLVLSHFNATMPPNSSGGVLIGFLAGLVAARAMMFLIAWVRFGWRSARSMRMY